MANPTSNKQSGNSNRRNQGATGSNRSETDSTRSSDMDISSGIGSGSTSGGASMSSGSDDRQTRGSDEESEQRSEPKSVGTVIAENLARESQEKIDRALSTFNSYFSQTTTYVSGNPREAAAIAVAAGMVAWVLLATKPGRKVFELGASMVVPELNKWFQSNFAGGTNQSTQH